MVAAFADTESAGAAVSAAIRAGLVPSLLEIMDAATVAAVEAIGRVARSIHEALRLLR